MNTNPLKMDRVLFGDNQFFGVNHMSEEKARAQAMRFQNLAAIIEVLDAAYQEGIRTFMCTTHDRIAQVCDHFRAHPDKYPDVTLYTWSEDKARQYCVPQRHTFGDYVRKQGFALK